MSPTRQSITSSRCLTAARWRRSRWYRPCSTTRPPPRAKNASSGSWCATGLRTPTTSGSSHSPGTIPWALMQSSTSVMPFGKRVGEGFHNPTLSHQPSPVSAYQPASMQKYSAPTPPPPRRSRRDQREQPLRGRVRVQGVHVIVEDHGKPPVILMRPPDGSPAGGQPRYRIFEPLVAHGDRDRHGGEGRVRREWNAPMVLGIRGPEQ